MDDRLYDVAFAAGVTVVTMAVLYRTPVAAYVTGSKKIFGVV